MIKKIERNYLEIKSLKDLKDSKIFSDEYSVKFVEPADFQLNKFLQRKLQIGYNRAARIIDMMEAEGVVSKANHVGKRDVLQ